MVARERRAALALLVALLAAGAAQAQCRTTTRVEPRRAFVGERVLWELEILRAPGLEKVEWHEAPRFPGFRAVWLPGRVDTGPVTRDGAVWRRSQERRALFAARAGVLAVPPASLRCGTDRGLVAGARVEVVPLPKGAPPEFAGVVGPVRVVTRLDPDRIELGGFARLWVVLRGPGNLWTVGSPLSESALGDVDVFAERPATDLDAGDDLVVRRTFRYQLVPRREGDVVLPPVRVSWFDPEARAYRISSGRARTLTVGGTATLAPEERP